MSKSFSKVQSQSTCTFTDVVAIDFIYKKGKGVKSAAVEHVLAPESSVPTMVSKKIQFFEKLLGCIQVLMNFLECLYKCSWMAVAKISELHMLLF